MEQLNQNSQKRNKTHGIISIIQFSIAIVIAVYSIYTVSILYFVAYLALLVICMVVVLFSYCTKCASNKDCSHIIIGKVIHLFPKRKQRDYSIYDYLGVSVPLLLIVGIPQYFLWNNLYLLLFFWIFFIGALIEIIKYVCPRCLNNRCLLCPLYEKINCKTGILDKNV
jgi:hypothetical protein